MINVIINADDLGLNQKVNNAINEALSNGFITSSTILANSDYMDEVRRIVKKYSTDKSRTFVNGVLAAYWKELKGNTTQI